MPGKAKKADRDAQIDENLKRVYDDVVNEAVPDRFLELIERLHNADPAPTQKADDTDDA